MGIALIGLIGLGVVALMAVAAILVAFIFRAVVPTNEVHILQNQKTTISYGKGNEAGNVYYNWPSWVPVVGINRIILPVSVFSITLNDYPAYDNERLPFVVDIEGFFRIEDSNTAAQRVLSFDEMSDHLRSILQGASRTILASSGIEQIMEGRSEYGEKFTAEVECQLKQWGVVPVKSIELMDIRDGRESSVIANIMEKRKSYIEMQSRTAVAENDKKANIAEVNAQREAQLAKQDAEKAVGVRTAEKEKAVGISTEQSKQAIEAESKTTTELQMQVAQVSQVRTAEIQKEVDIQNAEAERQTKVIKAEADLVETTKIADGNLVLAEREATSISMVGESNAEAARLAEMATVTPQIALAQEIGENEGYQKYLIDLRSVEKDEAVGMEQAKALKDADLKIIANSSDVAGGVSKISDILNPSGGASAAASLEMFANTDAGAAMLKRFGIDLGAAKDMLKG